MSDATGAARFVRIEPGRKGGLSKQSARAASREAKQALNLGPYAPPGSKIRLRFDIGNDGCTGRFGWFIDDVAVYTCR